MDDKSDKGEDKKGFTAGITNTAKPSDWKITAASIPYCLFIVSSLTSFGVKVCMDKIVTDLGVLWMRLLLF